MHPGLKPNFTFRSLNPTFRPTLQRLPTQKPHFLYETRLRRVRLLKVALRVLHRADDRRHSVAKAGMGFKKRPKRFFTQFRRRHRRNSFFRRTHTISRTTSNRTPALVGDPLTMIED